jgi:hypothetical protein
VGVLVSRNVVTRRGTAVARTPCHAAGFAGSIRDGGGLEPLHHKTFRHSPSLVGIVNIRFESRWGYQRNLDLSGFFFFSPTNCNPTATRRLESLRVLLPIDRALKAITNLRDGLFLEPGYLVRVD